MIELKMLENGFQYIEVRNRKAEAKIALQGAHIFHFQARARPSLLWLSKLSHFEHDKAIRGGVPICFPWFGKAPHDDSLPQHGFARTAMWKLIYQEEIDEETSRIELVLESSPQTKAVWDYDFEVRLTILISDQLNLNMRIHNRDTQAFEVTSAFHSYFNIPNIQEVEITGLEDAPFYDDLTQNQAIQENSLRITKEIDRYYWEVAEKVSLINQNFTIEIRQEASSGMVVWNPWTGKSKMMSDMQNDAYRNMLCLETAQRGGQTQIIPAEGSATMRVSIDMLAN